MGRSWRAAAVNASQPSTPPGATARARPPRKPPDPRTRWPAPARSGRAPGRHGAEVGVDQRDQLIEPAAPGLLGRAGPRATSDTSTAVTGRPCAAASSALPDGPQARSATGPSGRSSASAATATGCAVNEGVNPVPYLAFHRARSGCPARSFSGSSTLRRLVPFSTCRSAHPVQYMPVSLTGRARRTARCRPRPWPRTRWRSHSSTW